MNYAKFKKPENQSELQHLLNHVLKIIGDKRKMKVVISSRLKRYNALAHTQDYIKHGRRKVTVSKDFLVNCEIHQLIKTLIHEIAHFKYSVTRKLRKMWLKHGYGRYAYDMKTKRLIRKHAHTKRFRILVLKLIAKFERNS